VINTPALLIKKSCYSSITIASILRGKLNYSLSKRLIQLSSLLLIALNGSVLSDNFTGTPLRDVQFLSYMGNGLSLSFSA
jgi:hypothetical protein